MLRHTAGEAYSLDQFKISSFLASNDCVLYFF